MSDEILVKNCSPTLAGLKTGNLFNIHITSKEELQKDLRSLNKRLSAKGLRILPMRYWDDRVLLYLYRPKNLQHDLLDQDALSLLEEMDYPCAAPERCIAKLISKLKTASEFPHEIGLFLGYPPEDVRGFIENKADCYKCLGTWKVYGNVEKAQKTFQKYKKCTNTYCKQLQNGKSIEQLTVAV